MTVTEVSTDATTVGGLDLEWVGNTSNDSGQLQLRNNSGATRANLRISVFATKLVAQGNE